MSGSGMRNKQSFASSRFLSLTMIEMKETKLTEISLQMLQFADGFCQSLLRQEPLIQTLNLCKFNNKLTTKTTMSQHVLLGNQEHKTLNFAMSMAVYLTCEGNYLNDLQMHRSVETLVKFSMTTLTN